jgi:hypothetical protein
LLLLLIAAFALLWILCWSKKGAFGYGNLSIRGSLVLAYVAFQVLLLVLIITEVLSIHYNLTSGRLAISWGIVTFVLLVAASGPLLSLTQLVPRRRAQRGMPALIGRHRLATEEWIWIGVVSVIIALLAVDAYLYPPSNTDAMAYHLARVEHWIQNRTIAPFATHFLAQIELSPLAEYLQLHLHLLSGSDRFDASGELLAGAISVIGITELARLLGASRWVQIVAGVICATIPSGILLATSSENDYVAAAIAVCLFVMLAAFSFDGRWVPQSLIVGTVAGLAYLTKGDLPLMVGPGALVLLIVATYRCRRTHSWRYVISGASKRFVGMVAGVVAITLPFVIQNVQLFGSTVGPASKSTLSTSDSFGSAAANIVRATSSNFDIGDGVSGLDTNVARLVLGPLGHLYSVFGVSPNNTHYTLTRNFDSFKIADFSERNLFDSFGANPWHVLLMVASVIVLIVFFRRAPSLRGALVFAAGLTAGFLLFSALARWSPFNVRYAIPLLVGWSAIIALALGRFPRWVGRFVMIGLVVACIPQLLDNGARPLVSPKSNDGNYLAPYFFDPSSSTQAQAIAEGYETTSHLITQSTCQRAGISNMIRLEYPIWVALGHDHWSGTLNDFGVKNASATLEPSYRPCALLSQRGRSYVTPDNGTVNAQFTNLAVSINAENARSIRTSIPNFISSSPGVRLFPGGGWSLAGYGTLPVLKGNGSLYLFSKKAQHVSLALHVIPGVKQPSVAV